MKPALLGCRCLLGGRLWVAPFSVLVSLWVAGADDAADARWRLLRAAPVSPASARVVPRLAAAAPPSAAAIVSSIAETETEASPDIVALADALGNDPALLHQYVHDRIDYTPIFGSLTGAGTALRAGRGNDFAQASLLIALLRQAGHSANYVVGDVTYETAVLADWVGVSNNVECLQRVFGGGGVPMEANAGRVTLTRVWVELTLGGTRYVLDPAMKQYQATPGIALADVLGFDRESFLSDALAGASWGGDWVRGVNESNVVAQLAGYSTRLRDYLCNSMPSASLDEVLGARHLVPLSSTNLPMDLPNALAIESASVHSEIPYVYRHSLSLLLAGIEEVFCTFQIADRRMTVFFDETTYAPRLCVDGQSVASGRPTRPGETNSLVIELNHPYAAEGGAYGDQRFTFEVWTGTSYAIACDLNSVSTSLIKQRRDELAVALLEGHPPLSEPVLGQSLWLAGLTYFHQGNRYQALLNRLAGTVSATHHQLGLLGQGKGYFMNIPMYSASVHPTGPDPSRLGVSFRLGNMMRSAFEHGTLEQLQSGSCPAVSTVKLIQMNNANGKRTFLLDSDKYERAFNICYYELTNYPPVLQNYLSLELELGINKHISFLCPEDGQIPLGTWKGAGLIRHGRSEDGMSMIVSGQLYGGESAFDRPLNTGLLLDELRSQGADADQRIEVKTPKAGDPVDMATGHFQQRTLDLDFSAGGLPVPQFLRVYNSGRRLELGSLGYGWRHSGALALRHHSDVLAVLGERTAADAAGLLTYTAAMLDTMAARTDAAGWTTAAIATQWMMEQMTRNAVTVSAESDSCTFVRAADGTFLPPPGIQRHLERSGTNYFFQGETLLCHVFDLNGAPVFSLDSSGNVLEYQLGADGCVHSISNRLGHSLTFHYTDGLLDWVSDAQGRTVRFEHEQGDLVRVRDVEDRLWQYAYDRSHNLLSVTEPGGNTVVRNTCGADGRVIQQVDALGNTSAFHYAGFRSILVRPDGSTLAYHLDAQGRTLGQQDAAGKRSTFEYDGQGRAIAAIDRLGDRSTFDYTGAHGELAAYVNANGERYAYAYTNVAVTFTHPTDPTSQATFVFPLVAQATRPDQSVERYLYDGAGRLVRAVDARGGEWGYAYDARGQLQTVSLPTGGQRQFTYGARGTLATRGDSDTGAARYEYDRYDRLIQVTLPDDTRLGRGYDLRGRLIAMTNGYGGVTRYDYDPNGNLVRETDPAGQRSYYGYDALNRLVAVTNRLAQTQHFQYDSLGRLQHIVDSAGAQTSFAYDANGRLGQLTDPEGYVWRTEHDAEGVPLARIAPSGTRWRYSTDKLGRELAFAGPAGASTTLERDAHGRVRSVTDSLGRTVVYDHGPLGELTGVTDAAGHRATYWPDAAGLVTNLVDANGGQWQAQYTPMGRLAATADPLGRRETDTHDPVGRLAIQKQENVFEIGRTRDAGGNVGQLRCRTTAGVVDLDYAYDVQGRLTRTLNLELSYDAEGRITNTVSAGVPLGATYDAVGRLRSVTYPAAGFTVFYAYDRRGLVTSVCDTLGTCLALSYDADGRLCQVRRPGAVDTDFTWDADGRLARIRDGQVADQHFAYNAAGELTQRDVRLPLTVSDALSSGVTRHVFSAASEIVGEGYASDARGCLVRAPGLTFEYDPAWRLTRINAVTLEYDGLNDVVSRRSAATTVTYHYNHAIALHPLVAEKAATGAFRRLYVWTPEGRLLYLVEPDTGRRLHYHFDPSGSTLFLTDDSGQVRDAYAYSPYGELLRHSGDSDQLFTFVGQHGVRQEDGDGTLYQMRLRFYHAPSARFLSPDPVWPVLSDLRSLNRYQYANLNPLSYIDATGLTAAPPPPANAPASNRGEPPSPAKKWVVVLGNVEPPPYSQGLPGYLYYQWARQAGYLVYDTLREKKGKENVTMMLEPATKELQDVLRKEQHLAGLVLIGHGTIGEVAAVATSRLGTPFDVNDVPPGVRVDQTYLISCHQGEKQYVDQWEKALGGWVVHGQKGSLHMGDIYSEAEKIAKLVRSDFGVTK